MSDIEQRDHLPEMIELLHLAQLFQSNRLYNFHYRSVLHSLRGHCQSYAQFLVALTVVVICWSSCLLYWIEDVAMGGVHKNGTHGGGSADAVGLGETELTVSRYKKRDHLPISNLVRTTWFTFVSFTGIG